MRAAQLLAAEDLRLMVYVAFDCGGRDENFLLWQASYSELVSRAELWLDLDRVALEECLEAYRERRGYGERRARLGGHSMVRI